MKLVKKILGRLSGLKYPQEYLCMAGDSLSPLHVYLIIKGKVAEDITNHHNFVGYSPLIFTIVSSHQEQLITIAFTAGTLSLNDEFSKKDAIALLTMKRIPHQSVDGKNVVFFEGIKGHHHFLSPFYQFIIGLRNRLYQKKPGNVFLPGNLYKQVQIAYSVPRNISLITVRQDEGYNLFPTDLHGPTGEDHYIISLRHEGKACAQVMHSKKLLLSQVHSDLYKTVYSLGKNHMQDMRSKDSFPFGNDLSSILQLPLPQSVLFYRELLLEDSFIHGIHQLMIFKTLYSQRVLVMHAALAHMHVVPASWRHNKGLAGNYLLR